MDARKDCCKDVANLEPEPSQHPDLAVVRCRVCGCRHFALTVDPGNERWRRRRKPPAAVASRVAPVARQYRNRATELCRLDASLATSSMAACASPMARVVESVALGAFLAGSLVAESGVEHTVEQLVQPVRDLFAAIFFVSVGMLIRPEAIAVEWAPILVILALVLVGKIASVTLACVFTGQSIQPSARISCA